MNKSKANCRPRFRIMSGDVIALGPGKVDLLEAIARAGSISAAARERGLSYRRAWDMVDTMNKAFQEALVDRVKGGKGGGGTRLTPLGNKIVKKYRSMEDKAMKAIERDWKAIEKTMK